jgi:Amt family ammonium transporter
MYDAIGHMSPFALDLLMARYLLKPAYEKEELPMRRRVVIVVVALAVLISTFAMADSHADANSNAVAINTMWTLVAAILVFLMQAGFAMLETGFTRAKNAANIMMKNLMDFSIGTVAFWAVGYAIMFGVDAAGRGELFFLNSATTDVTEGLSLYTTWMFQVVFAATAATIVSGAVAERLKFNSYLAYSVFITAIIYPMVGHWIWGGGWLSQFGENGLIDFAGSTVVHSVGGWVGLAGAIVVGARAGKYAKHGNGGAKTKVSAIPGHNLPLAALGVFLLWFGWFGFNAGSTMAGTDLSIARIAVTTNLAAAAGVLGALTIAWIISGKPDPTFALNGAIAGLVAITAGTANVSPGSALIIGFLGGIIVVLSVEFLDRVLHIDDPVGAVSAHGVVGAWGTIAVGLFAQAKFGGVDGLFFGGGPGQLGVQIVGVLAVFAWSFGTGLALFYAIKKIIGLRVSREEELRGLDIGEHGAEAYSGFQIFTTQ